jgi:hypothetical protein
MAEAFLRNSGRLLTPVILVVMVLAACRPSPRSLTAVSGKTIYRSMALEDVTIEVYRWQSLDKEPLIRTKSGYHGSFIFYLPEGRYRLLARKVVRLGSREVKMEGEIDILRVEGAGGRMDRLLVVMEEREDL